MGVVNRRQRILFVSTYLSLITAAERELRAAGFHVRCAHNSATAFQCLFSEEIDVIVLCGALEWQQRDAIIQYVKRHWGTPIVILSPAKPNSIKELLQTLAAGDEHAQAA
jgi:DNA-binding response OmpR family regulator